MHVWLKRDPPILYALDLSAPGLEYDSSIGKLLEFLARISSDLSIDDTLLLGSRLVEGIASATCLKCFVHTERKKN